jgi:hypothetical protein
MQAGAHVAAQRAMTQGGKLALMAAGATSWCTRCEGRDKRHDDPAQRAQL